MKYIIIGFLFIQGCGSSGSTTDVSRQPKYLEDASGWRQDVDSKWFTIVSLTAPNRAFQKQESPGVISCECGMTILSGDNFAGTYSISACVFNPFGNYGGADFGCAAIATTGSYTNTAGALTLCDATPTCLTYH